MSSTPTKEQDALGPAKEKEKKKTRTPKEKSEASKTDEAKPKVKGKSNKKTETAGGSTKKSRKVPNATDASKTKPANGEEGVTGGSDEDEDSNFHDADGGLEDDAGRANVREGSEAAEPDGTAAHGETRDSKLLTVDQEDPPNVKAAVSVASHVEQPGSAEEQGADERTKVDTLAGERLCMPRCHSSRLTASRSQIQVSVQ